VTDRISLQELYTGAKVSYACGADVIASQLMLAATLLADPAFEEELKKEYPWITAGIDKFSKLTSGIFAKSENQDLTGTNYNSVQPYLGCLALAAESRSPFELEGVLRFIHLFDCMDKRDRLYGTLALVQWRSPYGRKQAIARPTPDYEKSSFQLATEVFCMLTPGGKEEIRFALSWVHHLFELFDLDHSDPMIREAITKRYTTRARVKPEGDRTSGNLRDYTGDQLWWSMRICESSSPEAREKHNLHCAESTSGEQFVTLLDHDRQPFAQAPLETSAGDFYVEMDSWKVIPESWSTLGIIVKGQTKIYQGQHTHSMLGLARRFLSQTSVAKQAWYSHQLGKFKFVNIYWDVDDIFLLYLSTLFQAELSIEHLVLIRICDPEREDSSFARFLWSADDS
jgi:hypothetical protein